MGKGEGGRGFRARAHSGQPAGVHAPSGLAAACLRRGPRLCSTLPASPLRPGARPRRRTGRSPAPPSSPSRAAASASSSSCCSRASRRMRELSFCDSGPASSSSSARRRFFSARGLVCGGGGGGGRGRRSGVRGRRGARSGGGGRRPGSPRGAGPRRAAPRPPSRRAPSAPHPHAIAGGVLYLLPQVLPVLRRPLLALLAHRGGGGRRRRRRAKLRGLRAGPAALGPGLVAWSTRPRGRPRGLRAPSFSAAAGRRGRVLRGFAGSWHVEGGAVFSRPGYAGCRAWRAAVGRPPPGGTTAHARRRRPPPAAHRPAAPAVCARPHGEERDERRSHLRRNGPLAGRCPAAGPRV
jgi:hypothetical protein